MAVPSASALARRAQRRERERNQRLESILRAAEAFFADVGYQATNMTQIADAAEVSVGTVYFYFKNKEELMVRILADIGYFLRNLLGHQFREAADPLDGFRRASHAFFAEFCRDNRQKLIITYRESVSQGEAVEALRRQLLEKLTADVMEALSRLAASRRWLGASRYALDTTAAGILGTYERLAYRYFIWHDAAEDADAIAAEAFAWIAGGIEAVLGARSGDAP
ncbi:MAG: TetR/AcrR family transcriptional regulator [Candidatus Schekmanbacteria bacterium]|nr:TetR/AcrR family transcriptional regulator [Candidatus Schekmanbacteria bacterium]